MTETGSKYGVHSEVGVLRKVLVCAPGLAHTRLTPSNCDSLLFDDVLWVQNAKRDHADFIMKMQDRGTEVVEVHNLLAETLANPEAKKWLLDRQITANEVGLGLVVHARFPGQPGCPAVGGGDDRRPLRAGAARRVPVRVPDDGARGDGHHRISSAAIAEHSVHPRHDLLDLWWRDA